MGLALGFGACCFLRRRRIRRTAKQMRASPTRGPITAPAIQALLEDFFLLGTGVKVDEDVEIGEDSVSKVDFSVVEDVVSGA